MKKKCVCIKDNFYRNECNILTQYYKNTTYEYEKYYSNINDKNYKHYDVFTESPYNIYFSFEKIKFEKLFLTLSKLRRRKLEKLKKASL